MEGYCTCGAKLADDALFCHRCGRPVRELVAPSDEPQPAVETPPVIAVPPPVLIPTEINFHNSLAVRICFLAAALAYLCGVVLGQIGIPAVQFLLTLVISAAAGFYAVYLYHRRSGQPLSTRNGARMGWMTGIFGFLINIVLLTFGAVALMSKGGLAAMLQEQAASASLPPEAASKVQQLVETPAFLALLIVFILAFFFATYTLAGSLGGMLGAKVLERD